MRNFASLFALAGLAGLSSATQKPDHSANCRPNQCLLALSSALHGLEDCNSFLSTEVFLPTPVYTYQPSSVETITHTDIVSSTIVKNTVVSSQPTGVIWATSVSVSVLDVTATSTLDVLTSTDSTLTVSTTTTALSTDVIVSVDVSTSTTTTSVTSTATSTETDVSTSSAISTSTDVSTSTDISTSTDVSTSTTTTTTSTTTVTSTTSELTSTSVSTKHRHGRGLKMRGAADVAPRTSTALSTPAYASICHHTWRYIKNCKRLGAERTTVTIAAEGSSTLVLSSTSVSIDNVESTEVVSSTLTKTSTFTLPSLHSTTVVVSASTDVVSTSVATSVTGTSTHTISDTAISTLPTTTTTTGTTTTTDTTTTGTATTSTTTTTKTTTTVSSTTTTSTTTTTSSTTTTTTTTGTTTTTTTISTKVATKTHTDIVIAPTPHAFTVSSSSTSGIDGDYLYLSGSNLGFTFLSFFASSFTINTDNNYVAVLDSTNTKNFLVISGTSIVLKTHPTSSDTILTCHVANGQATGTLACNYYFSYTGTGTNKHLIVSATQPPTSSRVTLSN